MDEKEFFREATLRICGSLEIEKALWQSLIYIREFMPAGQMSFHVYHRDPGIVETVAHATPEAGEALSIRSPLSTRARRQVEAQRSIRVRVIDRLGDDPVTSPVAGRLGALDLSGVVMDLVLERKMLGVFSVFNNGREKFNTHHVKLLSLLNEPCAVALTNSMRYRELLTLRDLLADDNRYLQDELRRLSGEDVVGSDFGLKEVMELVRQVAPLDSPVLLLGETGTGKEVIAGAIHKSSLRKDGPFITVNCGAIPETLLDSELFGYEKGAFTGALSQKRGRIERAHGGTLFLDEIGDLSPALQSKILRVIQEKTFERVGGNKTLEVDVRIISATHQHLESSIQEGRFRQDLYFRLNVVSLFLPPLRERREDIPLLIDHFIKKFSLQNKKPSLEVSKEARELLLRYPYPGNVRE
uniref:sigma-54 interaction domain-containing protein n=1 Tax=Desulfococcus sp. TaxID=2025834 RepID=UPI00359474A3